MALFYFVRHGETERNALGRLCGRTDVPLSEAGRRQAQLLALRFKPMPVETLYSSPLRRALETASVLGEAVGRDPVIDSRLVELNYGAWEGCTYEEISHATPEVYRAWQRDPGSIAPPGGESGEQLIERVTPFLLDVAERHQSGNVVVVCHRTVSRLIACYIMGVPLSEYRRHVPMDNAALNIFETREGKWCVVALNESSHLSTPVVEPVPGAGAGT
jgi:broad specificity phosphatase PhoE